MLPVVFERTEFSGGGEPERKLKEEMRALGGVSFPRETLFATEAIGDTYLASTTSSSSVSGTVPLYS
jgi:hypothetical protein